MREMKRVKYAQKMKALAVGDSAGFEGGCGVLVIWGLGSLFSSSGSSFVIAIIL